MRGSRVGLLFVGASSFAMAALASMAACSGGDESDAGARVDASVVDGAMSDARAADATPVGDVVVEDVMSAPIDAGGDAACAPSSDPYAATWRPPKARASVCSADDLETFWLACWNGGIRSAPCTSFTAAHAACGACIVSSSDDATRGALAVFTRPDLVSLNAPGCIALVEGDASCAIADQALHDCKVETCGTCATKGEAGVAFAACEATAQDAGCASYKASYDAKCGELANAKGALATCIGAGLSTHDYFTALASYFCGGASDAGDGGDGG